MAEGARWGAGSAGQVRVWVGGRGAGGRGVQGWQYAERLLGLGALAKAETQQVAPRGDDAGCLLLAARLAPLGAVDVLLHDLLVRQPLAMAELEAMGLLRFGLGSVR